jgi:type IV pilus assembly protein PilN
MYNLDINFLKDRQLQESAKTATQIQVPNQSLGEKLPILAGLATLVILPAAASGFLLLLNLQTAETQKRIQELDTEISKLSIQNQSIQEIEKKVAAINEETTALVNVFNQIKPWSAILQDIRDQIPLGVQASSIKQTDLPASEETGGLPNTQLTITGVAGTYDNVNDFLLTLQKSSFLQADKTQLVENIALVDLPIEFQKPKNVPSGTTVKFSEGVLTVKTPQELATVKIPQGVRYTLTTELNNIPASQLLRELTLKGSVGLVTRIRTLEQKGAIQP